MSATETKHWQPGESLSAALGEPIDVNFCIAMMPLVKGERGGVTIFIGADKDWSHRHFVRHGHDWLASAKATPECADYRDRCPRAQRLNYSGKKPADAAGMVEDLQRLGYGQTVIDRFLAAAAPWWPEEVTA